jgi:N-acetyl-gamma-glutamyl-phosphate reductase
MEKVAIIGATGYSGQELAHLLSAHPGAELKYLTARVDRKVKYADLYPRFRDRIGLDCTQLDVDRISSECDLVFLALPHTVSMEVAPGFLEKGVKVIDLSADYRIPADLYEKAYSKKPSGRSEKYPAVYGLPEINRGDIKSADLIANPGCYPTSVILGLLPIADRISAAGIKPVIDSKSGTTGAGRKAALALSFSEVSESIRAYKANEHQHIPEIEHILSSVSGSEVNIDFCPHLMPFKRGIMSTMYLDGEGLGSIEDIYGLYRETYKDEPFVRLYPIGLFPEIKDAAYTNYCDIGITERRGTVIIVSVIDNLLKGASGQAVQNMNIMRGLEESAGLKS